MKSYLLKSSKKDQVRMKFVNFANFVMQKINNIANIANIAMQKFVMVSGERLAVSGGNGVEDTMSVGKQPTNIQPISNLSLTINRFKLHIATLALFLCLGVGEMWGDVTPTLMYASGYENGIGTWTISSGTISEETTNVRTGAKAVKVSYNGNSVKYGTQSTDVNSSSNSSIYVHIIAWAKPENNYDKTSYYVGINNSNKNTAVFSSSGWTQVSYSKNSIAASTIAIGKQNASNYTGGVYYDDIVAYYSSNSTADVTAPSSVTGASATSSRISWTCGSDANTGIQNTLIWKRTTGSGGSGLSLNNQAIYAASSTDQSGNWTCLSASVSAAATNYDGTFAAGNYAIVHRDLAYNYSTPTYVSVPSASTWKLKGTFDDWGDGYPMTGSGTVSVTRELEANTQYKFKITDGSTWYGNSGYKIGGTTTTSELATSGDGDIYLNTTESGDYVFSFNTSTHVLTVTYPNSYTVYYSNSGSWSNVYVYRFTDLKDGDNTITGNDGAWPGIQLTSSDIVDHCGDYYEIDTKGFKNVIFNDNGSNKTGDMPSASGDGKYVAGTGSSWSAFPMFTVTYNKNGDGAGGAGSVTGSVPTDSNSPYSCGDDVTVLGNTGSLERTGYNFAGWRTAAGSGDTYAAGDTYEDISANTTFYAQWTREAPTSVSIEGDWAYFPGQTISLTAETTGGTSDFTYQWQKCISSVWTDLNNGLDDTDGGTFSGVTTENLQISGCTKNNCGTYRCVVSKAGLSVNSSDANLKIYTLNGNYTGESFVSNDITYSSGTSGTVSLELDANSVYEFKINDNYVADNRLYGSESGNYIISPVTFGTCYPGNQKANIRLFTGPAGYYTFTVDIAHVGDNSPYLSVSVAYPSVTHPAEGYAYFEKPNGWTNVYLYWYTSDSYRMTNWESAPEVISTANICGTTYYYAPVGTVFDYLKLKGNDTNEWTAITTTGCSGKYMDETTYASPSWESFTTYTISYAAGTQGTGSMSATSGICPDADQALPACSFTPNTGYEFDSWTASSSVKVGGETVTTGIADEAILQDVGANVTLTAQWTAKTCTLSYKDEGHTKLNGIRIGTYPTTHTYGSSTALTKATRDGYVFGGWYKDKECTNGPITSIGATDYDCSSNIYLYAKWTAMNLDALADNTLYKVEDMVPDGITPGSDVRRYPGVSENNRFNIRGSSASSDDANAGMTPRSDSRTIDGTSFTNVYRFDKPASGTDGTNLGSGLPANHAIQFKISGDGLLDIYCYYADSIFMVKDGGSAAVLSTDYKAQKVTKEVTEGTYYLYSTHNGEHQRLYGLKFTPTYSVTYNANGGSGTTTDASSPYNDGSEVTTLSNSFTYSGYKFKWWNTAANGSGEDFYVGEKFNIAADANLYAQWEPVASDEAFWVGDNFTFSGNVMSVGDMRVKKYNVDLNQDITQDYNQVNKQNGHAKKAKVMAMDANDEYIEIYFSDGSPIKKLYLGATSDKTTDQNIVVVYSATSDFTTAGGAAHEFKQVGENTNLVTIPGHDQTTKSVTDVSPSKDNLYTHARIYRRIGDANSVFDNTSNLGTENKLRIYSIKAKKGTYSYSITYDCDGADSGCPSNATEQTALPNPLPDAPLKSGYMFDGWYTNSGKTDAAVDGATLTANATLYAKWVELEDICETLNTTWLDAYTEAKGEGTYGTINGVKYDIETLSDDEDGITMGWLTNHDTYFQLNIGDLGVIKEVKITIADENHDEGGNYGLVADFFEDDTDFTYYSLNDNWKDGDNWIETTSVSTGDLSLRPVSGDNNSFAFQTNNATLTISSICVYYDPAYFTVTYAANGGSGDVPTEADKIAGVTVTVLGNVGTPSTLSKTNYTFGGWSYGGDDYDAGDTFEMPAENVTLTAIWTPETHDVTFNLTGADYSSGTNEGTNVAAYGTNYTVTFAASSGYTLPDAITVTIGGNEATEDADYSWDASTGELVVEGESITGDIVIEIEAEEDVTTYTVTYNANGGSSAPSDDTGTDITLNSGSGMTAPSGYTFAGWNTNATGTATGYAGGTTSINANLDLYAIWKPTTACADGYSHVYSYYDSRRLVNGKRYNAIETTTWGSISAGTSLPYTAISGLTSVVLTKGCQAENKIEAGYPWINSYIKVDKKSSTEGAGITITVASGYIGKLKIRAGGYSGNASIWNNGTKVVDATSGYATSQNAFTEQTIDLVTGANLIQFDGNNAYVSHIDVKLTQLYTLTLDKNNSDASGSSAGSAYVEPNGTSFISGFTAPTRTGYDVEGYYGEAGCTTKIATAAGALQASKSVSEVEYTNSSSQWTKGSGATLYANWTPKVYNITYKDCGDVAFSGVHGDGYPTTHTYGTATDLVAPTKEGCAFLGWFTDADGTSSAGASIGATAKTADFTLYAKWGVTIVESDFYQLYAMESKTRDQLITTASLPSYISTNITADAANNTFASAPTLTTPHDFSAIGTTKNYHIKTANTNKITITAVANVKTVRLYGYGSSKTVTATAINQSGGSDLSISNGTINASGDVVEASFNISGASGYSSSAYYTITLTFPGDVHLFGVYIETASVYPVTGVSLNKSSTTLTVGDTEQLTATIAPANATNKGLAWTSSNTSAATVSSAGLITAKAEGETTITVTTSDGSYTATCDVTVEPFSCAKYAGKIFELEVIATANRSYTTGNGTEAQFNVADVTVTDGTVYAATEAASSSSRGHIYYTSSVGYIELKSSSGNWAAKLNLTKCTLRNGDVISFTQKAGDSYQISITTSATRATTNSSTSGSYTVTPGDGLAGASTIYVWHASSSMHLKTLTITRPTSYVMTYNPNGGRDEVEAERMAAGANTLTTDVPTRAGYVFKEWNTQVDGEGTGYASGAVYTMPASASELFAKWVEPDYSDEYAYVILTSNTTANTKNATALIGGLKTNTEPPYQLDGNSDYFGITLATNFVAGDKVQFKLSKGSKDGGNIYKGTTSSDGLLTSFSGLSSGDNIYEIDITAAMISGGLTKTLAFVRTSSDYNHSVYWIKVKRKHCVNFMALKEGVTTWSTTASDWIGPDGTATAVPGVGDVVYLDRNVTVATNAAKAKDVILSDGKSLTIAATGGLVAAGTVMMSGGSATTSSDLIIESSDDGTGALITGEESTTTQATVGFYTKAIKHATRGYVNQYIGIPFTGITAYDRFYDTYVYEYIASSNAWSVLENNGSMSPFTAYNLMRDEDTETTLYSGGTLILPGTTTHKDKEFELTLRNASVTTTNMFANPYTAPIDITALDEDDDFTGIEATIYLFNAGSNYDVSTRSGQTGGGAGQWLVLPVTSVKDAPGSYAVTTIPSQQAFMVKGTTGASHTMTIDYKKHVYDPAKTSGATINPARAPKQDREETALETMNLTVQGLGGASDRVLIFMREDFTTGFDNGWDGRKMKGKTYAPYFYAATDDGKMAVNSVPTAEGTVLGFKAGTEDNFYTFSFEYDGEDIWYLNDLKEQKSTLIDAANTYTFESEAGDAEARFVISATPINEVSTGNEDVGAEAAKVRKVIINDHIYIIRGGRMYSVDGALVK